MIKRVQIVVRLRTKMARPILTKVLVTEPIWKLVVLSTFDDESFAWMDIRNRDPSGFEC